MARLMNKGPHGRSSQPPEEGEVGAPVYMAPEQIVGEGPWDHRADIYALGMIAYQLFGGQVPRFENLSNILQIKIEKGFVGLRKLREGIPEAAEQAIMRALEVDPNDRPASAREWFAEVSAAFRTPQKTVETSQPHATGDFEIPVVLHSQFADDDPEIRAIQAATSRLTETLYGGMKFFLYAHTDLRGGVFVSVIRQSYATSLFKRTYREARRFTPLPLVYIKRDTVSDRPEDPDLLSASAFEDLKKEMLADGAARFFDTAEELEELFTNDLTEWLTGRYLPGALVRAKESSPEAIAQLLADIKDPDAIDGRILDEVRRRQLASTGQYWFYLSCAQEDWTDDGVQAFFQQLNAEVRALAGASEFYVGAFRPNTSEVATTALRKEWFPETVAALQNSRVLVPLYTRDYFESEVCGKVWEFFQTRINAESTPAPIILPVLWSSLADLPYPLPNAVASILYADDTGEMGQAYSSGGLRQLKKLNQDQYEAFIQTFARRLVEIATPYPVQPLSEPPSYAEITNAFATESKTETTDDQTPHTFPPKERWIMRCKLGGCELAENIVRLTLELAREIARRGYGLAVFGRGTADPFMRVAFTQVGADEARLKRAVKFINNPDAPGAISTPSSARRYENDIEEMMKQLAMSWSSSAANPTPTSTMDEPNDCTSRFFQFHKVVRAATEIFRRVAELAPEQLPAQVSVSEYQKLDRPLETAADARHMSRLLLDMIDSLWLSPTTPRTNEEALSSIAFIEGNLLRQQADAIVNFVGRDPLYTVELVSIWSTKLATRFVNN